MIDLCAMLLLFVQRCGGRLSGRGIGRIDDKFALSSDALFQQKTGGLLTAEEFRKAREADEARRKAETVYGANRGAKEPGAAKRNAPPPQKKTKKKVSSSKAALLSFSADEDAEEAPSSKDEEDQRAPPKKMRKCPHVETSFLPDADREREELERRQELETEWTELQKRVKLEPVEITFSYWDGRGHRRSLSVPKGASIADFVRRAKESTLGDEFPELRGTSADNVLYVKEDLIIPHHYTFYDLIVAKARGK